MSREASSRPDRVDDRSGKVLGGTYSLAELDALAEHVDGAFVLLTIASGDRYRRRVFLTAKAAQRAAHNARERGHNVRVYLCELKPLHWLAGGDR